MFLKSKAASTSPWPFKLPRKIVRHFAGLMEQVLRDNDWKGCWEKEKPNNDLYFFRDKLNEETDELKYLLQQLIDNEDRDPNDEGYHQVDPVRIAREAADVANVAMMIADNWGRK